MRHLDSIAPLDQYLELKAEIKRLDEEMRALQPLLLDALMDEPGETFEHRGYRLSIQRRRTYAYSEAVDALKDDLRHLRRQEEATGIAQIRTDKAVLVLSPVKKASTDK